MGADEGQYLVGSCALARKGRLERIGLVKAKKQSPKIAWEIASLPRKERKKLLMAEREVISVNRVP